MNARFLAWLGVLTVVACGGSDDSPGGSGDGGRSRDAGRNLPLGSACVLTSQCAEGLYCADERTCQVAGTGGERSACTTSGDCLRGLVCVETPSGFECRVASTEPAGRPCLRRDVCLAGLFCIAGECRETRDGGMDAGASDGGRLDAGSGDAAVDAAVDAGDSAIMEIPCEVDGGVECDDTNACTNDQCVADRCVFTLMDIDLDGYASERIGSCGLDCNDFDITVNPEHTAFEATRHDDGLGVQSFDWNCNGDIEREFPTALSCASLIGTCTGIGWNGSVPSCGTSAAWGRCEGPVGDCAFTTIETRVQRCR